MEIQNIPIERVEALANLLNLCSLNNIKITSVMVFLNGFRVTFENWEQGDAIMHDGSYYNNLRDWETYGFPWDDGDVSTHSTEELVNLLRCREKNK